METTQTALRDMLTIRDYLRERRDDLHQNGFAGDAKVFGEEVLRLNELISKAEAEADA